MTDETYYTGSDTPQESVAPRRFLSKEEIWGVQDTQIEEIWIEEWNSYVRVKSLSAAERDAYENSLLQGKGAKKEFNFANARAKLAARAVVDENGKRMFTDQEIQRLSQKSASALTKIWDKARELAGMTDEDVEELLGNSGQDQSDDSYSG